jgi:signal transduction histidine kinase
LIDDILLIGRSGETGFTSQYQKIDFVEFVRDIVERIKVSDQHLHPIQVRMGRGCQTIISDKKLLSYILNNLLSNACKYSSAGSPILLKISVDTELHLTVADKGIGIPDNDISTLFETFHRGSNVGNIRGTGIGLSIVSQAIDKMNGRIHVQSKLNQGTTIKVDLPLLNDEDLK